MALKAKNADELAPEDGTFDVFILGVGIEHMDPTQVARLLSNLSKMAVRGIAFDYDTKCRRFV